MSIRKAIISTVYIIALGLSGIFLSSCTGKLSGDDLIVFTKLALDNFDTQKDDIIHKFREAQIVMLNTDKPEGSENVLTSDFYSACSPDISYDGSRILFTAQQNENDSWQVWEMNLKTGKSTQKTDFIESCFGPAYLPGDRMVFSKQLADVGTGSAMALYTMNLDGTKIKQISFQPHLDYTSTILRDGRILMLTKQIFPSQGEMMYLAMRPNGTKAELFYKGDNKSKLNHQVHETEEGQVFFTERADGDDSKIDIISVHQNRPLFSKINHTAELAGSFYSVFPESDGRIIVSYRASNEEAIGLYYFSPGDKSLLKLYNPPGYHLLESRKVEAYQRPRNLPDEVDPKITTGQLLCQDINVISPQADSLNQVIAHASKVEVLGIDESMGIVSVEEDGSFYLKIIADTPFRLQTLDDSNSVVQGPSGWIWVRPFERRGCVGCHEDPELTPENLVPLSVKKAPISIPIEVSQSP